MTGPSPTDQQAKFGARTTVAITTLNRPGYLERTLEYFAHEHFAGVVQVGDGTRGELAKANADAVARWSDRLHIDYIAAPDLTQAATMKLMADRVTTEFAAYCGDDDYLVPEAISDCEHFLDANPDFVSAHGAGLALNADGVHGLPESIEPYRIPELRIDDPLDRLSQFFLRYGGLIFAVHRREVWREMFRVAGGMLDKAIAGEIAPCAVSALLGKCAEIDGLYVIRQIHQQRYHLPLQEQWVLSPGFGPSCALMLGQLRELSAKLSPHLPKETLILSTWTAAMGKIFQDANLGGRRAVPHSVPLTQTEQLPRFIDLGELASGSHKHSPRFAPVYRNMIGSALRAKTKPRLLLLWGNPYVLDEAVAPILPDLADRFSIVLLLVNYRMTPKIHEQALAWKEAGLVADVLVAPSHGGTVEAHVYMRNILPVLKSLDFEVFVSISAMQPCECYIIEHALPASCARIVFWPHPTNLFLYPELSNAVVSQPPSPNLDAVISRLRRRIQPNILKELLRPAPGWLGVWGAILTRLIHRCLPGVVTRQPSRPQTDERTGPAPSVAASSPAPAVTVYADGTVSLRNIATRYPRLARMRELVNTMAPLAVVWVEQSVRWAYRWRRARERRKALRKAAIRSEMLSPWLDGWPSLRGFRHSLAEQYFPYTLDRYIYPWVLVGESFPFGKLDWITQIGTDQFDACLLFNEEDARLQKILFDTPNVYPVRYVPRTGGAQLEALDAVLFAFTLHSQRDLTPELLDIYARDMGIALRESGAAEIHVRPHPGALDDWLQFLVVEMRSRGIPCQLVSASRPISDEAARYRGLLSAVSGSLRDARLACPHIFVVGSVGISITHIPDPKRVVGFPESIGWIEADGTYDPRIFKPTADRSDRFPTAAEAIISLHEGKWARVPDRLRAG